MIKNIKLCANKWLLYLELFILDKKVKPFNCVKKKWAQAYLKMLSRKCV